MSAKTKKKLTVVAAIIAILFVAAVAKNVIAKNVVIAGARAVLGIPMKIDSLDVGVFRSAVRIQGLTVYNPEGFEGEKLADGLKNVGGVGAKALKGLGTGLKTGVGKAGEGIRKIFKRD